MSFARILQQYHRGDITKPELDSELDLLLADVPPELNSMVAEMERVSEALQVDPDIVQHMRTRIATTTGYPIGAQVIDRTRLSSAGPLAPEETVLSTEQGLDRATEQSPFRSLQPGDVLGGRFRLERMLGRGGMSQVFLAEDQAAYGSPRVAVKVLSEAFSTHPDALITLKRETAKAQQLAHPNIVNVRDFGIDGPYVYMWMEYLDGGSLHDELKRCRGNGLTPTDADSILQGACAALDYAHQHQIVHADLKPANFMLTRAANTRALQAKVIDFGIARTTRSFGNENKDLTIYDPGKLQAMTLSYASPEMQQGMDPDPRDDIYALGCIAYEIYTGKHPFDRISAEQAKARRLTVEKHTALNSQQFRAICRAVAFDRNLRTPTASEFLREFRSQKQTLSPQTLKSIGWGTAAVLTVAVVSGLYIFFDPFYVDPFASGTNFKDCATCPYMTVIPAGHFMQGTHQNETATFSNEQPVHDVSFVAPFAVSSAEISVAEYREFAHTENRDSAPCMVYTEGGWILANDHSWADPGFDQSDNHPVTCVSWSDANSYAEWLTNRTGESYRLPSASEWEYVASAANSATMQLRNSETPICSVANVADRSATEQFPAWKTSDCIDGETFTAPVASFGANEFGLYDVLGNVFEWVLDCWNTNYIGAPTDGKAWLQGDCSERELRGGSWFTQPELVYFSFRNRLPMGTRASSIGFRVVRELDVEDSRN